MRLDKQIFICDYCKKRVVRNCDKRESFKLFHMPCTLCGNNCRVSPLEQFKARNELCKEREQMYRSDEND